MHRSAERERTNKQRVSQAMLEQISKDIDLAAAVRHQLMLLQYQNEWLATKLVKCLRDLQHLFTCIAQSCVCEVLFEVFADRSLGKQEWKSVFTSFLASSPYCTSNTHACTSESRVLAGKYRIHAYAALPLFIVAVPSCDSGFVSVVHPGAPTECFGCTRPEHCGFL